MSTYAISDIHGCYQEFIELFDMIHFDYDEDQIFFLGDYIDRGMCSYDMIEWIKSHTEKSFVYLRGNHEQEFIENVNILNSINSAKSLIDICTEISNAYRYFDMYGTIRNLIKIYHFDLEQLNEWKDLFSNMKYYARLHIKHNNQKFILVHAGYSKLYKEYGYTSLHDYNLYARGECVYSAKDLKGYTIIAGHTPTIFESELVYKKGKVFTKYNRNNRCIYHNIDCGSVYRNKYTDAKLACYRIDDGEIYYV